MTFWLCTVAELDLTIQIQERFFVTVVLLLFMWDTLRIGFDSTNSRKVFFAVVYFCLAGGTVGNQERINATVVSEYFTAQITVA